MGRHHNVEVLISPSQVIKETKFGYANARVMTKIQNFIGAIRKSYKEGRWCHGNVVIYNKSFMQSNDV